MADSSADDETKPIMPSNSLILEHVLNDPELLFQVLQAAQVATRVCGRTSSVVQRMEKLMEEELINTYNMPEFNIGRPSAKSDGHTWHDGPIEVTQAMVDCLWTKDAANFRSVAFGPDKAIVQAAQWNAQSADFFARLKGKAYIHATLGRYKGWTLDGKPDGEGELVLARLCAPNTIETTSCRSHWVL